MTGTLWIPGGERITPSSPGGTPNTSEAAHPSRVIWHTTEAPSGDPAMFQSMMNVLTSKGAEPQVLWDPVTDRLGQFMPLDHTGRSVQNDGNYRSNRIGTVCIQIEVIAYSNKPFTDYWKPGPKFQALMAAIRSWGIPDVFPMGDPPKYPGPSVRDRAIWLSRGGHYSHANIPSNSHGDPGAISVSKLFAAAGSKPVTPPVVPPVAEDNMANWTEDQLRTLMREENEKYGARLWGAPTGTGTHMVAAMAALSKAVAMIGTQIATTDKVNDAGFNAAMTDLNTKLDGLTVALQKQTPAQ